MYAIIGADGFFGAYFQQLLIEKNEPFFALNHRFTLHPNSKLVHNLPFEVTDAHCVKNAARMLDTGEPIYILYLAAAHHPDTVKKDPAAAKNVNTVCYERFLRAISSFERVKLIYASSDTVYGESENGHAFLESDRCEPVNEYGCQKLLAEKITGDYGFTSARFPYLYGASLTKKTHFYDEIVQTLKKGEPVSLFTDYIRSSISYQTASGLVYQLFKADIKEKAVNVCADEPLSKYEMGLRIARAVGAPASLIRPVFMADTALFSERRAGILIMNNGRLRELLRIPLTQKIK